MQPVTRVRLPNFGYLLQGQVTITEIIGIKIDFVIICTIVVSTGSLSERILAIPCARNNSIEKHHVQKIKFVNYCWKNIARLFIS